jgi:hypothetical protein
MKKYFFLLPLILLNFLSAQNETQLDVIESEEYRDKFYALDEILVNFMSSSGLIGVVRKADRNVLFEVFDEDFKPIFNKLIKIELKEKITGYVTNEDQIKVFTVYSPKAKKRIIYCYIFNLRDRSYKRVQVFGTTLERSSDLLFSKKKYQKSFGISPNGNFIVIATQNIKKNTYSYTIRIFNSTTFEEVYKQSYREDINRFFELNDLFVNDEGKVFVLGKLFFEGKSQKKSGEANYQFVINKITQEGVEKLEIKLADEHIKSLSFSIKDNELQLLGFYSKKNIDRIKGACVFIVNFDSFQIVDNLKYELPEKVYKDLYGSREIIKKKGKELSNFKLDFVLKNDRGDSYWLAEEFYITYRSSGYGTFNAVYNYDNILVLKFNSKNELLWGRSIFKKSFESSYYAFLKEDKLHVILNSGKELKKKNNGRIKSSKAWLESTALYDFVYSKEGDVSYDKIQDNKGKSYYRPYYGIFQNGKFVMMNAISLKRRFMILE